MHRPCNEWLTMFSIAEIPPPTTSPTTTAIPTDSSTPIGWKNTPDTTRRQNHTKNRKKGLILNGKCSFFASLASLSKLQGRRHRKNQRNLGDVHFTDRRQATSFAAGEDMGKEEGTSLRSPLFRALIPSEVVRTFCISAPGDEFCQKFSAQWIWP